MSLAAHVVGREQTELKAGPRGGRQLKVSENGRLKTRAEEECGNKPRCGLYSPIHVDMDMGVRVVKRPLYTAHVGAGAFLWKTGKRHGKWRFHNVSTG